MNFTLPPTGGLLAETASTMSSYWSGNAFSGGTNLSKGWKPFKAELKGNKLYFYKPPYDRSAGIRELFPTSMQEEKEEPAEEGGEPGAEAELKKEGARKRRAYWGRGTHPDLVLSEGTPRQVMRGSFEALVHEAVFRTTFADSSEGYAAATDFAHAVILCLPTVIDRAKFEAELQRCCSHLVSGADENEREAFVNRAMDLARIYLKHHEEPADAQAWEEWRAELVPNLVFDEPMSEPSLGRVSSSDPPRSSEGHGQRKIRRENLTKDNVTLLEPATLASSLTAFQQATFAKLPPTVPLDTIVESNSPPSTASASATTSLFFGTDDNPHWLTKLVLTQVLISDSQNGTLADPMGRPDSRRPRGRPGVLSVWAIVGELCRLAGDACSWRAIATALTCRPIARLSRAWKRVDNQALAIVRHWAEDAECDVREPRDRKSVV